MQENMYVLDHSVWNKIYVLPEEFSLKHTGGKLDSESFFFCLLASKMGEINDRYVNKANKLYSITFSNWLNSVTVYVYFFI